MTTTHAPSGSGDLLSHSTPVGVGDKWFLKYRTPEGEFEWWSAPRDPSDDPVHGRAALLRRPGAERITDGSTTDPLAVTQMPVRFSPDGRGALYAVDTHGDERLCLHLRDLDGGGDRVLVTGVSASYVWAPAPHGESVYFCALDPVLRPAEVFHLDVGTGLTRSIVREERPTHSLSVRECADRHHLVIHSAGPTGTSVYLVDGGGRCRPLPLGHGHWHVDVMQTELGPALAALSNRERADFELLLSTDGTRGEEWQTLAGGEDERIRSMFVTDSTIVLEVEDQPDSADARSRFVAVDPTGREQTILDADRWDGEPALSVLQVPAPGDRHLAFLRSTPIRPPTLVLVDIETGEQQVPVLPPVRGRLERLVVRAGDGQEIPVTVLLPPVDTGSRPVPCVIEVYGAYGGRIGHSYDPTVADMVAGGTAVAFAHVRGGGERGQQWRTLGMGPGKIDALDDLDRVVDHLRGRDDLDRERFALWGGSAGGTLAAAYVDLYPGRVRVLALDVPFLDPVGILSDPSRPLSIRDLAEWGDPRDPDHLQWMSEYCPAQLPAASADLLVRVSAGTRDPRAPADSVARWVERHSLGRVHPELVLHEGGHMPPGLRGESARWLVETLTDCVHTVRPPIALQEEK